VICSNTGTRSQGYSRRKPVAQTMDEKPAAARSSARGPVGSVTGSGRSVSPAERRDAARSRCSSIRSSTRSMLRSASARFCCRSSEKTARVPSKPRSRPVTTTPSRSSTARSSCSPPLAPVSVGAGALRAISGSGTSSSCARFEKETTARLRRTRQTGKGAVAANPGSTALLKDDPQAAVCVTRPSLRRAAWSTSSGRALALRAELLREVVHAVPDAPLGSAGDPPEDAGHAAAPTCLVLATDVR